VLERFGEPLAVTEVDLAEPKAGEALVRLVACGVCHTDMYRASGVDPSGYAPIVLGHEGAGVVEAVGPGVSSLAIGDHVVTLFSPQCGECVHCRSSKTNTCLAIREQQNKGYLPDGTTRLSGDGEPIRHFMGTSTFAEYTGMPEIALAKVSPDAPLDRACLFACGLSTGLRAAMYTARVKPGSTCVVFGAGMVGLGAVAGCRLQGAERVICVDLSEERVAMARGQGATDTWQGGPGVVERIRSETDGFGADYTFEATGLMGVMREAVEAARMGWGLCTIAGVAGKGETLEIITRWLIQGRRVCGSSFGGVKGRDQVPGLIDRYLAGEIDVDAFISHRITLAQVNRGFELMAAQDGDPQRNHLRLKLGPRMDVQHTEHPDWRSNAYLVIGLDHSRGVVRAWRDSTDPPGERCPVAGEPAELLPWGPDDDGRTRLGCGLPRASRRSSADRRYSARRQATRREMKSSSSKHETREAAA
jgi:S-(hydroxymethyl)glutathione dehydrogenase/alcohol dehydrogenase